MAYRQILWIKLEKRLLNDYRFYTMSRDAQLIFLKILMLSAETNNKIPKNPVILGSALRETLTPTEMKKCLEEMKANFPKFKESKHFYHFVGWKSRHNWYLPSNSSATPEPVLDKNKIKKEDIDKIREEYIRLKGWSVDNLYPDDYARINKGIKNLLLKTQGNTDKAVAALEWQAKQGYEWTIETVVKKYPDFLSYCPICQNKGRFENERGYKEICECSKGKALKSEDNVRL